MNSTKCLIVRYGEKNSERCTFRQSAERRRPNPMSCRNKRRAVAEKEAYESGE